MEEGCIQVVLFRCKVGIMSDQFNKEDEWYYNPYVRKTIYLISVISSFITRSYIMPFWMFYLMFFIGGMPLWYSIVLSIIIAIVGYKIWSD